MNSPFPEIYDLTNRDVEYEFDSDSEEKDDEEGISDCSVSPAKARRNFGFTSPELEREDEKEGREGEETYLLTRSCTGAKSLKAEMRVSSSMESI